MWVISQGGIGDAAVTSDPEMRCEIAQVYSSFLSHSLLGSAVAQLHAGSPPSSRLMEQLLSRTFSIS